MRQTSNIPHILVFFFVCDNVADNSSCFSALGNVKHHETEAAESRARHDESLLLLREGVRPAPNQSPTSRNQLRKQKKERRGARISTMTRPTTIILLSLALCSLLLGTGASRTNKSIDLTGGSLDNGLERESNDEQHPHEAPDKPSKLDLDFSQFTETDDKDAHELERIRLQEDMSRNLEVTTIPTTAEQEKSAGQHSKTLKCDEGTISVKCVEKRIKSYLRTVSTVDTLNVTDLVQIVKRSDNSEVKDEVKNVDNVNNASLVDEIHRYARDHVVKINLSKDLLPPTESRTFFGAFPQGKSTFLTGFGLGFLAFGLKKLLLPIFIGVQIVKSILIALFLPSIIGSLGKIVGKGVTSFAQSSHQPGQQMEENYEFKENTDPYNDDYMNRQPLGTLPASAMYDETMLQTQMQTKAPEIASRYAFVDPRLTPMNALADRYYTRHMVNPHAKRQDFKVFHEIPTSSLLLTNYDPFYSPLLSRLDAVFARLGHHNEGCREYAICAMYRSPARYAPYSNLVSAQLSRELNELRKPSSDNPDVLRFFRYMKAAKDGQDGVRCEDAYAQCDSARDDQTIRQNQAMLATYQDIDKLVHARKL